jgi:hypothetical protein
VSIVGEATADQAVRVPAISFTVQDLAAPDLLRQIDPLRIGIRYGDFHSRRLVDHLGLQAAGGVVRVSMVHYNTVDEIDRLIAGLTGVNPLTPAPMLAALRVLRQLGLRLILGIRSERPSRHANPEAPFRLPLLQSSFAHAVVQGQ